MIEQLTEIRVDLKWKKMKDRLKNVLFAAKKSI